MDLRTSLKKDFFFQTSTMFFPPLCKHHDVIQNQEEDQLGEDDIIDMIVFSL